MVFKKKRLEDKISCKNKSLGNKRIIGVLGGICTAIIILLTQPVFAAEVLVTTAEEVALNFIDYLDETYFGEKYTISKIEPFEDSGKIVGYLAILAPQGYILVAADTIRVPIKAYSLSSNFDTLPPAYIKVLLNELKIESVSNLSSATTSNSGNRAASSNTALNIQPEEINSSYWEFLTQAGILSRKSLRSYTPDTFLLTTKWNQGYPYNKFNPKVGEQLTLTGCVQTALAQVMRYHRYPSSGGGIFEHTWNGQTLTAVMNHPFNWDIMPDSVNGSAPQYQQDEVAALMRDLGVLNEANFGTDGTSAYFHNEEFERAFGYAPISQMDSDNVNFFTTIKNEINNLRPVLLSMPGHLTVADGYASDASGKKIHVNLGWGGSNDDYYYLDQTIITDQYTFPPNHTIYYNIKPCQAGECNPYTPTQSGNAPIIASDLSDMIIENSDTIRIEAYDLDGDTVTLSADSSCDNIQTSLNGNLLTITPIATNIFCELTITANSYDGTAEKSFKVLVLEDTIYIGEQYDIGGRFADEAEIDEYKAYLEGNTIISGNRGYSNQAFYIWVKDSSGNMIISALDSSISGFLTAGLYTIGSSLRHPSNGSYYKYNSDFSGYTLTVKCNSLNSTVSDLAYSMGITLSDDTNNPPLPESITSYKVLTSQSPQLTVNYGEYVKVFGSSGINTVNVKSGGRVECANFAGANVVNIDDYASYFMIHRSGATVYLESNTKGTKIKIPATKTSQTLNFGDKNFNLVISNGKVMLGDQQVTLADAQF
ncbi:MAG: C10 family peptidase [Desulfamplus sp.]|nr:C10 family peptidase [Desulfamplus sp.]